MAAAARRTTGDAMGNIGAQFVELFTANKWMRWTAFWLGWLILSPETLPTGSIAVMVGVVFYKERAFNLVTISAAWLGIMAYLILGHIGHEWPENVRLWMGFASIFSLIVLGKHYPWFGWCMLVMIAAAFNGAGRRRR